MSVRVRFAPSPTGHLHVGGARTALFNWLFARQTGGVFILRIEDTDPERSTSEMVEGILEGLRWLGLDWDEGPHHQSQRLDSYRQMGRQLLEGNHAYRCFCTPELLLHKKAQAPHGGRDWKYDGSCRKLSDDEIQARLEAGDPFAVRFRVPENQQVSFKDLVYGDIQVETKTIEDFVLLRSDGTATYHLSVVADDTQMRISHVVRGADHLPNTSKHVLLCQALEEPLPLYVHLPLILGPDKKRLSKRHGATSVLEYRQQGFIPEAMKNYLARLGWSPGDDNEESLSEEQLIRLFDLSRINKANALFDPQKLEWMNAQFLSSVPAPELESRIRPLLQKENMWDSAWEGSARQWFLDTLDLIKPRARRLSDFIHLGQPFFSDSFEYESKAAQKYLVSEDPEVTAKLILAIQGLAEAYRNLAPFDLETTEQVLRKIGDEQQIKAGKLIGAVRVALTGKSVAPGIFDVIVALDKKRTLERLDRVLKFLQ
ncbi:MAG: glutamate--tRNA ligase [Acidobacteriota bacterium]